MREMQATLALTLKRVACAVVYAQLRSQCSASVNLAEAEDAREGGRDLAALRRGAARKVVGVVVAELQEALQARAGVVRALPLKPVRQHQHQPRALAPPLLACRHSMDSPGASSGPQGAR